MKKLLVLLLTFVILCTSLLACNSNDDPNGPKGELDPNHTSVAVLTDKDFVLNGASDYVIVIAEDATDYEKSASSELYTFLYEATGAKLLTATETATTIPTTESKYIFIGKTNAGLALNEDFSDSALTQDGFKIITKDNNYYLLGGTRFGSVYAVYELLYHLIGWECYAADEIVYETTPTVKFKQVTANEIPDFEYRVTGNIGTYNDTTIAMRFRYIRAHTHGFAYVNNNTADISNLAQTAEKTMPALAVKVTDKVNALLEKEIEALTPDQINAIILEVLPEKNLEEALTPDEEILVNQKIQEVCGEKVLHEIYAQTKAWVDTKYEGDEDGLKELIKTAVNDMSDDELNALIRDNDTTVISDGEKQMILNVCWAQMDKEEQAKIDAKLPSFANSYLTAKEIQTIIDKLGVSQDQYKTFIGGDIPDGVSPTTLDTLREELWSLIRKNCVNGVTTKLVSRMYHNCFAYLPASVYNNPAFQSDDPEINLYNPDWYSNTDYTPEDGGYYKKLQICYAAHGNKEAYQLMVEKTAEVFIQVVKANPEIDNFQFSQEDNTYWCNCPSCQKDVEVYGANSASVVKFLNDVYALYESKAEEAGTADREVNLLFFAYHATLPAPTVKNANGEYELIKTEEYPNGLHLKSNVYVFFAPIYMDFYASIHAEVNASWKEYFDTWAIVSDKLFIWYYNSNFQNYLIPYGNINSMQVNYTFAKEKGTVYFFDEGQHYSTTPRPGGFSYLKDYLGSKLMWNVNVDVAQCIDNFFTHYFKDAAPAMRKYYNDLQNNFAFIHDVMKIAGSCIENVHSASLWKEGMLLQWLDYIEEAYQAVEKYAETDKALYNKLVERIKIESIAPRYLYLSLYLDTDTSETTMQMKRDLKKDLQYWNWGEQGQGYGIDSLWTHWGV